MTLSAPSAFSHSQLAHLFPQVFAADAEQGGGIRDATTALGQLAADTAVNGSVLAALYERSATTLPGGVTAYRNYARVAAKYPVGKHEFHINHGVAGSWSSTPSSGANQSTLGYNYNFVEQTKVYAFVTRIRNMRNAAYSFLENTPNGLSNSSIALGVRHNF